MSTRTDIVLESYKTSVPEVFRKYGTEDMTFYSAHNGLDLQGRDAVADGLEKALGGKPTMQLHGEPVEQGNFVVTFAQATLPSGEERELCGVYRFTEDDQISGVWTMRA